MPYWNINNRNLKKHRIEYIFHSALLLSFSLDLQLPFSFRCDALSEGNRPHIVNKRCYVVHFPKMALSKERYAQVQLHLVMIKNILIIEGTTIFFHESKLVADFTSFVRTICNTLLFIEETTNFFRLYVFFTICRCVYDPLECW